MTIMSAADRMAQRKGRLSEEWFSWRAFSRTMDKPPLLVMEWLSVLVRAAKGGEVAIKRHIAGDGLLLGSDLGACGCDKPGTRDQAWDLFGQVVDYNDFDRLRAVYDQAPWDSGIRAKIRAVMIQHNPHRAEDFEAPDSMAWLHANHPDYNRAVKRIIGTHFGLAKFRRVLMEDLASICPELGREYGMLLLKSRARAILDNVVDTDSWCRPTI